MTTIPTSIPLRSLASLQRFPRTVISISVVLLFAGAGLMLHAESQIEFLSILVAFFLVFLLADRTQFGREVVLICGDFAGFTNFVAFLCAVGLVVVFGVQHYVLLMVATVALFSMACLGLNLQMAFGGVPNFAGAAFFCIGSYTAATMSTYSVPPLLTLFVSGVLAGLMGIVLLLPVLRTRGHYAALVTIAFGLLFRTFMEVSDLFGGPQGMKIKSFSAFGVDFNRLTAIGPFKVSLYFSYALLAIIMLALTFSIIRRVEKSWVGIAIDAVRSDEVAASAFGLSIVRWKIVAFLVGNTIIGMAGSLYGMMNGFVNPNGAGIGESLLLVSTIVLGGVGNLWGTIIAATVLLIVPEKLQAIQEYRLIIFSLLVIAILLFRPSGLLPRQVRDLSWLSIGLSKS